MRSTSFEVNAEWDFRLPLDIISRRTDLSNLSIADLAQQLSKLLENAKFVLRLASSKQFAYIAKKHRSLSYEIGDEVFHSTQLLTTPTT